jgi:hypothetical protein
MPVAAAHAGLDLVQFSLLHNTDIPIAQDVTCPPNRDRVLSENLIKWGYRERAICNERLSRTRKREWDKQVSDDSTGTMVGVMDSVKKSALIFFLVPLFFQVNMIFADTQLESQVDQAALQKQPAEDFFPLYPGTVWRYNSDSVRMKVLAETALVEGAVTKIVKTTGGLRDYYTNDAEGVRLHREFQPNVYIPGIGVTDMEVTLIPPMRIAAGKVAIGQTINSSGIARTNDLPVVGVMELSYYSTFTVEASENITVPAGNFDTLRLSGSLWIQGQGQSLSYNLAEGVGPVRAVSGTGTLELSSYTLGTHVRILSPEGGEAVRSGDQYTITWESSPDIVSFKVWYSLDNGFTWVLLTPKRIHTPSLAWDVPTPKASRTDCLVKVTGYDAAGSQLWSDRTSGIFTIEVVRITSPSRGESLSAGIPYMIRWDTNGLAGSADNFTLRYTTNGGATWKIIHSPVPGEGNPGSYLWDAIPSVPVPKNKSRIKLLLHDASGKTIGKAVSAYFTLQ